MFNSLRIYLKKKIEASRTETNIQIKLHNFLGHNPEVDHYLSDETKRRTTGSFILGLMFGIVIALMALLVIMAVWMEMGYLDFPRW